MTDITASGAPAKDFMPFVVNNEIAQYGSNSVITNLDETLRGEQNITAENISINKDILNDVMKLKTRTHNNQFNYASDNDIDGETDTTRALAIAGLRDTLLKVQDIG